jgi:hypothetical protein
MSDFGRLRRYDRFFIPIYALVWTAGTGWMVSVQSPTRVRDFFSQSIHTGFGAHPAFYLMDTVALSSGIEQQGYEADHSPSNAKVKNSGPISPLRQSSSARSA